MAVAVVVWGCGGVELFRSLSRSVPSLDVKSVGLCVCVLAAPACSALWLQLGRLAESVHVLPSFTKKVRSFFKN